MKRLLLELLWIAVSIRMFQALPCKPELAIEEKTEDSVTLKWTCKDDPPGPVAGFRINYNIKHRMEQVYVMELRHPDWATYTLRGLKAGNRYQFYIEAYDQEGSVVSSEKVEAFLGDIELKQPCKPKLEIGAKTMNSVTLKWECEAANTSPIKGYSLEYYLLSNRHTTNVMDLPGSAWKSYILTGLSCGERYQFFVEAYDHDGAKNRSEVVDTLVGENGEAHLPNPEELLEIGENSVTLKLDKWKSNCPVQTFTARLRDHLNTSEIAYMQVDGSAKSMVLSELKTDTQYALFLSDGGHTPGSEPSFTFKTLCGKQTPDLPSAEDALKFGPTYAVLHLNVWRCVDTFDVGYRLPQTEAWTSIANDIKPEQKSVLIPHLSPETPYELRVAAYNKLGFSKAVYRFSTLKPTENVCGDWMRYKQKCLKAVPDAGRLLRSEAQRICEELEENGDIPSLITISTKEEQQIVEDMIRNITGSIWLGLKSDDGKEFHWDDESVRGYTNWATSSVGQGELRCAVVYYNPLYWRYGVPLGQWAKTSCTSRNYVACEKPIPWNSAKLQKELTTTMRHMARMQKEVKNLQLELAASKVSAGGDR